MTRTRIKMCGTTNIEDALSAVQLGVDALGFIFVEKSPRFVTPEDVKEIVDALPPFHYKIGVFVNEDQKEVEEIVHYLGLNCVQLHGNEEPGYCRKINNSMPSCSVIKAFRVGSHSSSAEFTQYNNCVSAFLLDTYVSGQEGGTGVPFDWRIINTLSLMRPVIIAGGINPLNVKQALQTARPYAIDINSGVERSPGIKDYEKLCRLVEQVVEFDKGLM